MPRLYPDESQVRKEYIKADVAHLRFCPNSNYGGIMSDGFFAEYAIVDARLCAILPDSLTFQQVNINTCVPTLFRADLEAAPLTCAGTTIYGSIKTANLKAGEIIGISGLGALGHLGVQIAKAMVRESTRPDLGLEWRLTVQGL